MSGIEECKGDPGAPRLFVLRGLGREVFVRNVPLAFLQRRCFHEALKNLLGQYLGVKVEWAKTMSGMRHLLTSTSRKKLVPLVVSRVQIDKHRWKIFVRSCTCESTLYSRMNFILSSDTFCTFNCADSFLNHDIYDLHYSAFISFQGWS